MFVLHGARFCNDMKKPPRVFHGVAFAVSEYQVDTLISKCGFLIFLVPIMGFEFELWWIFVN